MKLLGKVKRIFKDAISEHRFSFFTFLLAMIIYTFIVDGAGSNDIIHEIYDVLEDLVVLLSFTTFGVLLCEAIHLYKKSADPEYNPKSGKVILRNVLIILASFIAVLQYRIFNSYIPASLFPQDYYDIYLDISRNIFIFVMVAVIGFTLYFFYKRSGESFETYAAKAFCGFMKAELVYGIIALGAILIIWAFDTLIFDTYTYEIIERVEILILALVQFPCAVSGLSKTEGEISKFEKIVLSYVFTGIIAVAFVIIYLYIFKIVFTWTFPSNEVFAILTALFVCGVLSWTMAQGCCDEVMKKPLMIMPFLFVPFIILQIMSLYMRVKDYGFTASRYYGLMVIIFEIIYFAIYVLKVVKGKDYIYTVLFVAIAGVFITFLMPGVNVYNVITMSQKSKMTVYIQKKNQASEAEKNAAYEAYKEMNREGGLSGRRFIDKNLNLIQIGELSDTQLASDEAERTYITVYNSMDSVDVKGFDRIYFIETDLSNWDGINDISNVPLYPQDNSLEPVDYVDLTSLVDKLKENEKYDRGQTESEKEVQKKITTKNGNTLIITKIYIFGFTKADVMDIRSLEMKGYVLE